MLIYYWCPFLTKIATYFNIDENILTAQLDDNHLNNLLKDLFGISQSTSFQIEDLPVEETMRSFFEDPENYLK